MARREFQLHTKGLKLEIDKVAMRRVFAEDEEKIIPLGFFVKGYEYKVLGLFSTNAHFFGPVNPTRHGLS